MEDESTFNQIEDKGKNDFFNYSDDSYEKRLSNLLFGENDYKMSGFLNSNIDEFHDPEVIDESEEITFNLDDMVSMNSFRPITDGEPDRATAILESMEEDLEVAQDEPIRAESTEIDEVAPEVDTYEEKNVVSPPDGELDRATAILESMEEDLEVAEDEPVRAESPEIDEVAPEVDAYEEKNVVSPPNEIRAEEMKVGEQEERGLTTTKAPGLLGKLGSFAKSVFDRSDRRKLADKFNSIFHPEYYGKEVNNMSSSNGSNATSNAGQGKETPGEELVKDAQQIDNGLRQLSEAEKNRNVILNKAIEKKNKGDGEHTQDDPTNDDSREEH